MSKIKVGINGFGRIGRLALRAAWGWPELEFVAINDPGADTNTLAHLLNFDSVHGRWNHEATADGDEMVIDGQRIRVTHNKAIADTDWSGCDLVIEASGVNKKVAVLQGYLNQGVKRVVVTAPVKEPGAKNIVMGVNEHIFDPANDRIITAASCTTNCLAPVVEALHKTVGIESGLMTTIHSYTNDQKLSDVYHTDLYRARSATQSMIPTKTGAAAAIGKVIPDLNGKLDGLAVRVPTINVSLVDFGFIAGRDTTIEEINEAVKAAAENNPVLGYNVEKLVSVDFNHNALSSVFDANHTRVIGRHVKVMAWYDNEWGFSNRMLDNAIALMNASK